MAPRNKEYRSIKKVKNHFFKYNACTCQPYKHNNRYAYVWEKFTVLSPGFFKNSEKLFYYSCSAAFFAAKHSLQYTGLSSLGWKGPLASLPHSAQVVVKYSLWLLTAFFLACLQSLHLWGSFWKPLSA